MALVAATYPWEISVTLGATNDRKITKQYVVQAPAAALIDDVEAFANDIMSQLALVSAGKVVGYKVSKVFVEDNYTRPTDQDAEWGEEATITGKILNEPFKSYTLRVPFPKADIFVALAGKNRDIIDIADAAVVGYVGLFNTGGAAYVSDGEFTETIEGGRRVN